MLPSSQLSLKRARLEILDYVIVEDGGVLVNPMIVDGQVLGGAAQGIGTALYEEMRYDAQGQPLASTLSDYVLPGPTEVPDIRILHMETPSPYTRFGQKGIGEGGAIAPPAAITNAINDALKDLGAELLVSPITPRRIAEAIERARTHSRRMKPAPFEYVRPQTVDEAVRLAGRHAGRESPGRRPNAWGPCSISASRSPLFSLISAASRRLLRSQRTGTPSRSAPRSRTRQSRTAGYRIRRGAFYRRSPRGIAYRAVRTRGTIGGSLAHADPAADWLSALTALGAEIVIAGPRSRRRRPLRAFVRGAMETELAADELLVGIRVPQFLATGAFRLSQDLPQDGRVRRGNRRRRATIRSDAFFSLVAGATGGQPLVIRRVQRLDRKALTVEEARRLLLQLIAFFSGDAYELKLHAVALKRACDEAYAA